MQVEAHVSQMFENEFLKYGVGHVVPQTPL
jgi:hypothetical protein